MWMNSLRPIRSNLKSFDGVVGTRNQLERGVIHAYPDALTIEVTAEDVTATATALLVPRVRQCR